MSLKPLILVALLSVTAAVAQEAAPEPTTAQALDFLKQHQPQQALDVLGKVLANDPKNAEADLLAASAELALYNGPQAVSYAEHARDLDPGNWKVHTTLVTAYAMAGDTAKRDAERATLRDLHAKTTARDAHESHGFLLDLFRVKDYHVEAIEYFAPLGKLHLFYRFLVRDATGKPLEQINVTSEDFDQASWAKAHPQAAAAGQRQYQLTAEGPAGLAAVENGTISGTPTYDQLRERVVSVLSAQATR